MVSTANPNYFDCMTVEQSRVAKSKLNAEADQSAFNPRVFDFDIAKLLSVLRNSPFSPASSTIH